MFIKSLVVAKIEVEQMLGIHGTRRQATLSMGEDLSCCLYQCPQTTFLLLSCPSGGPKQCLHHDPCLLCLWPPFLSCWAAHFPEKVLDTLHFTRNPSSGYLWAAGHCICDVVVKCVWRHLTGRNRGSFKNEGTQASEFLSVFTAHICVKFHKHDCRHNLQCPNLLWDHLTG